MVQFRLTDAQPPLPGKKSERPLSIFSGERRLWHRLFSMQHEVYTKQKNKTNKQTTKEQVNKQINKQTASNLCWNSFDVFLHIPSNLLSLQFPLKR